MSKRMGAPFFEVVGIGMQSHFILFKPCPVFFGSIETRLATGVNSKGEGDTVTD